MSLFITKHVDNYFPKAISLPCQGRGKRLRLLYQTYRVTLRVFVNQLLYNKTL